MDRQIYPSYAKIRLMRSEIEGFGTIVSEILYEICEDPTYAMFTVYLASSRNYVRLEARFPATEDRMYGQGRGISAPLNISWQ